MQLVSNFAPLPEMPSLWQNFMPMPETMFPLRHRRDPTFVTRSGYRLPMKERSSHSAAAHGGEEQGAPPLPSSLALTGLQGTPRQPWRRGEGTSIAALVPSRVAARQMQWWMRVIFSPHILSWSSSAGLLHVGEVGGATWGKIQAMEKAKMKVQTHSSGRRRAADGEEVRGSLA